MNDGRPQQSVARTSVAKGRYRLNRQLGEGGMGSVFEGVDTQSGRGVAVKVLRREVATDAQIVQRFLLEAETLSKIRHLNIVQLIESGQEPDGSLFIVQELLSGYDLRSKLEGQRMPIRDAFDIALPIMGALVAAHDKGVLHRDIKPENIFLTRGMSGETYPKLIDFGLSKSTGQQPPQNMRLTRSGMPIGTPFYMSPEQARAEPDLNGQADVWSLAVVIYEMIAGRCPHQESNLGMLMYKILSEPVPRIEQFAPQVPPDVAALLHRALESDRARRWPTMRAFLTATLQCPSLAAAPGEIDLAARHKNSLPDPRLPVDAFAKTMAIPSAADVPPQQPAQGQPAEWNPSRTAPFLLTPGGAAMKREIDRALDAVRKKNEGGGDTGAHSAQQPQRDSFASTMPGPGNLGSNSAAATPPAIVNTPGAGSFGTTTPGAGPALMQRNSNMPEPQMSADIPAAKEEAYSFGPAVNSATPPPSEFDAPPPVVPKTTPWALIVLGSIVVSGAITFAALKLRSGSSGSNATTPTAPAVVVDAGAVTANANAANAADASAAAVPAVVDAGATATPDAAVAAVPEPPAQNPPAQTTAGTHSTHSSSHTSSHHTHTGSSGGGFNIVDPNALQHAQQQEGH